MRARSAQRVSDISNLLLVSKSPSGAVVTEFGRYLRALAASRGYTTDAELSRAVGIDGSLLSKWWSGAATPSLDSLRKVAPVVGARLGDLMVKAGLATPDELGMTDDPPEPPPPLDPVLAEAAKALADTSIPDKYRDNLRQGLRAAITTWRVWINTVETREGTG